MASKKSRRQKKKKKYEQERLKLKEQGKEHLSSAGRKSTPKPLKKTKPDKKPKATKPPKIDLDPIDVQEVVKILESDAKTFPRKALEMAIALKEQIIPFLLEILEYTAQNLSKINERERYRAHLYAMYLLAQFREKRAYPIIVKFFSIPGKLPLYLTGDVVTEDLGRILASVSCGDTSLMESLVENEDLNEYVRSAALQGQTILVARGEKTREEIITYYQSLFQGKIQRNYSFLWNMLVTCCDLLYPDEVYDEIKKVFEEHLLDPFFISLDDVEDTLTLNKEKVLNRLRSNSRYTFITNTIREMSGWSCFCK